MDKSFQEINQDSKEIYNEEIDIKIFFNFFNRNKVTISIVSILSFIFACVYAFSLKRVWEGQFQIVLNSDKKTQINPILSSSRVSMLIGNSQVNNLKTKVGILQSPSVLMPIYELVNEYKNKSSKEKNLFFRDWKKNLFVELEKDTSILNIAYRDTNKEIILPALKKMSLIYKDYSNLSKKRSQEITKKYLVDQKNLYKKKSSNSLKIAQEFAIDQDLIFLDKNVFLSENQTTQNGLTFDLSNLNIENVRVQASNEIRKIDLQIKKINEISAKDAETLQYIGSTIPALMTEGLPNELKNIETELVELRTKYTENSRPIILLLEKRDLTIGLLKKRAIKYLKASRLEAEALKEAAMRPKGVLLKYKELLRQAKRDEATLIRLENDLAFMSLQQARVEDPWELITNPTLLDQPVAPSRRKIGLFGLALGFLFSSLVLFLKERKSGIFFENDAISHRLSVPIIDEIDFESSYFDSKEQAFFNTFIRNNSASKIKLIEVGKICSEKISKLDNLILKINKNIPSKNITFFSHDEEYSKLYSNDVNILLIEKLKIKERDLNYLEKQKQFFKLKFDGILFL